MSTERDAMSNLAGLVLRHAETVPDRLALVIPREWTDTEITREERVTYGELAARIARFQAGLSSAGFEEGDRIVIMFPVSVDLYALVLAMLASGLVAVFVDTGMGKERVLDAVKRSEARAIVSVDALMKFWPVVRALWGRRRYSVDRRRLGVALIDDVASSSAEAPSVLDRDPGSPALMTFTSGSTGRPRAANRTHDILIAQHHALHEEFPTHQNDVDMTCFPVVPLHNLCCGITTVMPAVDLRAPASVNARLVVEQANAMGVTRMTGAPAYLDRIATEAARRGLDTVHTLGCGGAPTPRDLCRRLIDTMVQTDLVIIYGSTEAEPIASTTMQEFVESDEDGYLVGRVAEAATVELVDLPEAPPTLDERELAPYRVADGEAGEVVVRGAHVLRGYVDDPAATARTKLHAPDGGVWHRTGDVARRDGDGRLWLLGRLDYIVHLDGRPLHPYPIEARVDEIDGVRRSALITTAPPGTDATNYGPELVLELEADAAPAVTVPKVYDWLEAHDLALVRVEVISEIPMDPRHNSKVARRELRAMREREAPKSR